MAGQRPAVPLKGKPTFCVARVERPAGERGGRQTVTCYEEFEEGVWRRGFYWLTVNRLKYGVSQVDCLRVRTGHDFKYLFCSDTGFNRFETGGSNSWTFG